MKKYLMRFVDLCLISLNGLLVCFGCKYLVDFFVPELSWSIIGAMAVFLTIHWVFRK